MTSDSLPTHRMRSDVAVVVATFEREAHLRTTITQLAAQPTLPGRVIVVDQADPARNNNILAPLAELGVRSIYIASRYRSISAARNIGLAHSHPAEIVLYIDDDVELLTDVVREHASYYDQEPDTVAVAGHVQCPDLSSEFVRLNTFRPQGQFVPNGRGCHMSFRTHVLREIGGFNAYICNNGDETELYRRLAKAGYKVRNGNRAVINHLVAPAGGNRIVGVHTHAGFGRVLRDGMVRIGKDRGLATGLVWPIKNWKTLIGLMRTAPGPISGVRSAWREWARGLQLARLSLARTDYIPISLELSTGRGVDPKSGLPCV